MLIGCHIQVSAVLESVSCKQHCSKYPDFKGPNFSAGSSHLCPKIFWQRPIKAAHLTWQNSVPSTNWNPVIRINPCLQTCQLPLMVIDIWHFITHTCWLILQHSSWFWNCSFTTDLALFRWAIERCVVRKSPDLLNWPWLNLFIVWYEYQYQ